MYVIILERAGLAGIRHLLHTSVATHSPANDLHYAAQPCRVRGLTVYSGQEMRLHAIILLGHHRSTAPLDNQTIPHLLTAITTCTSTSSLSTYPSAPLYTPRAIDPG